MRARGGGAEGLTQRVGQPGHRVDAGAGLGHGFEEREVLDLLIDVATARLRIRSAGQDHQRRTGEIEIAQPGRQIRGTDTLGEAHADAPGSPGVAIGHVDGGLLPVGQGPPDRRPPVHFRQRVTEDRRHEEDVRDALGVEAIGEELGTGQARH
jgi:hypothetical protein